MIRSASRTVNESRWLKVLGTLNEYQARLFVADKALDQGRGGISRLSELAGMSRTTITKAAGELNSRKKLVIAERGQVREAGGCSSEVLITACRLKLRRAVRSSRSRSIP